jgi:hypothetical protein
MLHLPDDKFLRLESTSRREKKLTESREPFHDERQGQNPLTANTENKEN